MYIFSRKGLDKRQFYGTIKGVLSHVIGAFSSVGQSNRLITGRSRVRVPEGPPGMAGKTRKHPRLAASLPYRGIAQLVEQRSPKPRAEGSSPSAPARNRNGHRRVSVSISVCANALEPEARGACRATLATAASGGSREQGLAQRSAIGKAVCRRRQSRVPQEGLRSDRRQWRIKGARVGAAVGDWQGGVPPQTEPSTARGVAKRLQVLLPLPNFRTPLIWQDFSVY